MRNLYVMNFAFRWFAFVAIVLIILTGVYGQNDKSTYEEVPLQRLASLAGKKYEAVSSASNTYSVEIISKVATDGNVTVLEKDSKGQSHVLGRNNDTDVLESDNWVLLMYNGMESYNSSDKMCNGTRISHILIICNRDVHEPKLKFIQHAQKWKNGSCFYMFELSTCAICPAIPDEGLSRGSVFCIVFLTLVGVYLIVGICYRRMFKGAKGFEQIPHHRFWIRLGNLQADGCNFFCRREEEETWQRLATSEVKDLQDDQDDALLRP